MKFEIQKITPELAAKYLEKNDGNRKLREHRAAYLARSMVEGKWKLTHQAIAIGKRGRLLDGQHRLRAVLLANVPADMVVATDVPEETFAVLDAGMPRKMHERLRSDAKHTSICSIMFRIMTAAKNSHEYEIQLMLDIFKPALLAIEQVPQYHSKFSRAPIMAAIALRTATFLEQQDHDAVCRLQWLLEKCRRGDMNGAPPIIRAYYRQVVEGVRNTEIGVSPETDFFSRTWVAFDPDQEGVPRLQITDHSTPIREARQAFKAITQGVFD